MLNSPVKYKNISWGEKYNSLCGYIVYKQYTRNIPKNLWYLKIKGQKKTKHANTKQNRVGVTIIITDEIDFKIKAIFMDRECPNIRTKVSAPQEDLTTLKYPLTNKIASNNINQKLIDPSGQILSHTRRL